MTKKTKPEKDELEGIEKKQIEYRVQQYFPVRDMNRKRRKVKKMIIEAENYGETI